MTATAEDKLRIIEGILATNDTLLLQAIKNILHRPVTTDQKPAPMSLATFTEKFERAERELLKTGFPDVGQVEPLLDEHPAKPRYLLEGNYKIIYL